MHKTGVELLNLMFRPGETICPHHTKYAYDSIPLEKAFEEKVVLVPVDPKRSPEMVKTDDLLLVALNPIKGTRNDGNVYAYRNFLVEMDYGPLAAQMVYAKDQMKIPYSAVVFSGSKSLHFLIALEDDLKSEDYWRLIAEWTLKIANMADQNTKNPSRSIRIPGAFREPGKQQKLVEIRGRIKYSELKAWLDLHPDAEPKQHVRGEIGNAEGLEHLEKQWVKDILEKGIDVNKGRNKQWFAISCEFALAGYSEDATIRILEKYYVPDRDFKEREWLAAIKSGFKHISRK